MSTFNNKSNSQMLQLGKKAALQVEKQNLVGLSSDPIYQKLREYHQQNAPKLNLHQMFKADSQRFSKFR